jgi:probable HAF family extracellular repeat protein
MKTLFWARCFKRDMLIVGSICLLLLSAAKGQSSYTITDLGTLGGSYALAYGINNSGQIVGYAAITGNSGGPHAFLYSAGQLQDLNNFLAPNSGWMLSVAYGINDSGHIVGYGVVNNALHAFLLTPASVRP